DGVYLDIIDAYEYFGPDGPNYERDDAAAQMVALVAAIARRAREERGNASFLVVPQNGAQIIEMVEQDTRAKYLQTIDAIGAEDTFFYGDRAENNPLRIQKDTLRLLHVFRESGRPVLALDYLTDPRMARRFTEL